MVDGPSDREGTDPEADNPTDVVVPPTEPVIKDSEELRPGASARISLPAIGYQLGDAIGRGGMGEVISAFDQRIGRTVAVKRMRTTNPTDEATARFLREARIQARLDHPAVVPVHELGTDEAGRPYFTMKKLAGKTLGQRITEGASQNLLLRAFVDVCLAIEFAHARGVVHRDLKPPNIMLGDYGEVYVLDWGVARVLAERETPANEPPQNPNDIESIDETKTGTLLGTPGYIAPEQLKGDAATTAADVYALGSLLFELLSGEMLHPKGHQKAIASTLTSPQEHPSRRRPDRAIPPELDALCFQALAEDPLERPTAHQLAYSVQAYLDGDRDIERRRTLATEQLRSAHDALGSNDPDARTTALRHAGRALALDPESAEAGELVSSLLLEPPNDTMPRSLVESLDEHERQINRDRSRKAVYAYLSVFALLPVVALLDVKNWQMIAAFYATIGIGVVSSIAHVRTGRPSVPVILVTTLALAIMFTRIASPFMLTPLLICCALAAITSIPWIAERPWVVFGWTTVAVMLPIVFEWIGLLPDTWRVTDRAIVVDGDLFYARGQGEELALVGANLMFTLVVAWLALAISRRRLIAQRQLYVQAWHLGQLIPSTAQNIPATARAKPRLR